MKGGHANGRRSGKTAGRGRVLPPAGLFLLLLTVGGAFAAEPVDLDDVYCALCHFDEGDDFAAGIHYQQGLLLCNDCHGGLPFESEEEISKAPETGFIGKPSRHQIVEVCGKCHAGPAEFLAMGPHGDVSDPDNATCISCHGNHRVESADLSLMDETCGACHASESSAVATGDRIRTLLLRNRSLGETVRGEFDSLSVADARLRRVGPRLRSAFASLRQADTMTHAWDTELITDQVDEFRDDLALVESGIQEQKEGNRLRLWLVACIWVFVVVNLGLLRWRLNRQG